MCLGRKILLMALSDCEEIDPGLFGKLGNFYDFLYALPGWNAFAGMRVVKMVPQCIETELKTVFLVYPVLLHLIIPFYKLVTIHPVRKYENGSQ